MMFHSFTSHAGFHGESDYYRYVDSHKHHHHRHHHHHNDALHDPDQEDQNHLADQDHRRHDEHRHLIFPGGRFLK